MVALAAGVVLVMARGAVGVGFDGLAVFGVGASMVPAALVVEVLLGSVGARLVVSPLPSFVVVVTAVDASSLRGFVVFGVVMISLLPFTLNFWFRLLSFSFP